MNPERVYWPPEVDFNDPNIRAVYQLGRRALLEPDAPPYSLLRDDTVVKFDTTLSCEDVYAALAHARLDYRIYQEFGLKQE